MENRASSVACRVAVAVGLVVFGFTASAAWTGKTYTWTGGAGDGKWSTPGNWKANGAAATSAPTESDALVFDSGSDVVLIDEGFAPTQVYSLTLDSGFGGTVRMQRDFTVAQEYRQRAGTFVCGEHIFQCGIYGGALAGVNPTYGHFYLDGGRFGGPVNQAFRWYSRSHQVEFIVDDAAEFDCSKADFKVWISSQGGQLTFTCANRTFKTFELMQAGSENAAKTSVAYTGTNTVLGTFTHGAGIFQGTKNVAYGNSAFYLEGDLVLGKYPQGVNGQAGMHFIMTNAQNQTVTTVVATNSGCSTAGLLIDKPAGKVTFTGDRFNISDAGSSRHHGFVVRRGEVDMSGLKWFNVGCYITDIYVRDDVPIQWADRVGISGYTCHLRIRNQTFHHLRLNSSDSRIGACYATTNTVTGWLEDYSFGLNGTSDKSVYPELTDKTKPPVLLVRGPGLNIITNASNAYAGNYSQSGGYGVLVFDSEEDQVVVGGDSRVYLPSVHVQKPAGKSLTVDTTDGWVGFRGVGSGTAGGDLLVKSGIFSGPTNRMEWSSYNSKFQQYDGAVVTNMDATYVNALGWSPSIGIRAPIARLRHENNLSSGAGNGLQILDGYTCTVTRLVTTYRGYLKGNAGKALLDVKGDFEVGQYCDGGYCPTRFSGDKVQHFSNVYNRLVSYRDWEVAKSGGRLVLDTDMGLTNSTTKLIFKSGELDVNGHRVTTKGEIVLHGGATLGVPAAPEVNELPWVATTGQLTEKNATAANPFVVRLTNARSYFDGPTLTGRVNVFGYGSFEKNTTHDPKRFTAAASCGVSKRSKVLDDAEDKILYLNYRINEGTQVFVK